MAPIISRIASLGGGGAGGFTFGRRKVPGVRGGPFSATGGNISGLAPGNGYVYHTFTSSGTFVVSSGTSDSEWIIVAPGGGGASGNGSSGGGGGGGIVNVSAYTLQPGTYTITIPGGGAGSTVNSTPGSIGGDTTVTHPNSFSITAKGGGYGAGWGNPFPGGGPGGSGGGGNGPGARPGGNGIQPSTPQTAPGAAISSYGNPGGSGNPTHPGYRGGGGGGAGSAGSNGQPDNSGGQGGSGYQFSTFTGPLIGIPTLSPLNGYYAGGGGGGNESPIGGGSASGGAGGGGASGHPYPDPGDPGVENSGGGGGAGTYGPAPGSPGGNGGSGIVIVRYPSAGISLNSPYRYWRLYKTDSAVTGPWHNEIQWTEYGQSSYYQGTNYQNWSHSGLVSFTAARVTDGDAVSQNAFHTDSSGVGSYALLDLGAGNEKYFNKVEIWLSSTGVNATWNIQASNDGSNWTTFYTGLNVNAYTNIAVNW